MTNKTHRMPPWWLFALISIGAFIAAGIFIGIMSIEGITTLKFIQTVVFGILGLIMFWGTKNKS